MLLQIPALQNLQITLSTHEALSRNSLKVIHRLGLFIPWLVLKVLSVPLVSAPATIFALLLPFWPIFPVSYFHKWMTSNQPFERIFLFRGFIISCAFVYVRLKLHGMCLSHLKIDPVPEFRLEWQYSFSLARKDDPFPHPLNSLLPLAMQPWFK